MARARKPLSQQVLVITGATSGIGLATARKASKAGAAVVLTARNEGALRQIAEGINAEGGRAHAVAADVGSAEAVERVARAAIARFGGFDAWINVAGVGLYGELAEIPHEDHEQLFRTNYFGVVNGSLEALKHFRTKPEGGTIINVGSVASDVAMPLLGAYSASKHAVKGFTDALRIELKREGSPVTVSLIKPSGVNTPFADHARNYMDKPARVVPPVYAPEVVADALLHAAERPVRHLTVGAGGRPMTFAGQLAPALSDRLFGALVPPLSRRKGTKPARDNLYAAGDDGAVRTPHFRGRRFSVYTAAHKHPGVTLGVGLAALAVAAAYVSRGRARRAAPLLRRAGRRLLAGAVAHRPAMAARLAARHPKQAWRLAAALR